MTNSGSHIVSIGLMETPGCAVVRHCAEEVVLDGGFQLGVLAWMSLDIAPTTVTWTRRPLTREALAAQLDDGDVVKALDRLRQGLTGRADQGAASGGLTSVVGPNPARSGGLIRWKDGVETVCDVVSAAAAVAQGADVDRHAELLLGLCGVPWLRSVLRNATPRHDQRDLGLLLQASVLGLHVHRWRRELEESEQDASRLSPLVADLIATSAGSVVSRAAPVEVDEAIKLYSDVLVALGQRVLATDRAGANPRSLLRDTAALLDEARIAVPTRLTERIEAIAAVIEDLERRLEDDVLARAVPRVLEAVITAADADRSNLPPDLERSQVAQPIWVRRVGGALSGEGGDAAMLWNALKAPWRRVTVRGLPGYGKSWLVRDHVSAQARQALRRFREGTTASTTSIAVWVDCARFGAALPGSDPTTEDAIGAVADCVRKLPDMPNNVDAVLARAHEEGLATICLDGLDEVPAVNASRVRVGIGALSQGRNQILVTTRPIAETATITAAEPGVVTFELLDFTAQQALEVARRWFPEPSLQFDAFRAAAAESPLLIQVPLLTSFLCAVIADLAPDQDPPRGRAELYETLIGRMLSATLASSPGRAVVDSGSPLDSAARMRVVGAALGTLFERWRSGSEVIDRNALSEAYESASNDDLQRVTHVARARWRLWVDAAGGDVDQPPLDPITWELLFDGLLVEDEAGGVRFAHPTLREYLLARHVASVDRDALGAAVEEHRWFDPSWYDVLPLVATIAADPNPVLQELATSELDPWFEQRLQAGRCLALCGPRGVDPRLSAAITAGVVAAVESEAVFERDRGLEVLSRLTSAQVPEALAAARRLAIGDALRESEKARIICMLGSSGDPDRIEDMRGYVRDVHLPLSVRVRAVEALARLDDESSVELVATSIIDLHEAEAVPLVRRLRVDQPWDANVLAKVFGDQRASWQARLAAGRALIDGAGRGRDLAVEVALDPLLNRLLAGPVVVALLNTDDTRCDERALELLKNPNTAPADKAALGVSLAARGHDVINLIERYLRLWTGLELRQTARAISRADPSGIDLLVEHLDLGQRDETRLECARAILAAPDATSDQIAAARGALRVVRRSAQAPVDLRRRAVWADATDWPNLTEAEAADLLGPQGELIMWSRSVVAAAAAGHARIVIDALSSAKHDLSQIPWNQLMDHERAVIPFIERLMEETTVPFFVRFQAAAALAERNPAAAAMLWQRVEGEQDTVNRHRFLIMLATAGAKAILEPLKAELPSSWAAHEALFWLLDRAAGMSHEQAMLAVRAAGSQGPRPAAFAHLDLDREFAEFVPADASSEVRRAQLSWLAGITSNWVDKRVRQLMLRREIEDLARIRAEDGEDAIGEWLRRFFPEVEQIVTEEVARLKAELADGTMRLPPPEALLPPSAVRRVAMVGRYVAEWCELRDWEQKAQALETNGALRSPTALRLMETAALESSGWPDHEAGHLFALKLAVEGDVARAAALVRGVRKTFDREIPQAHGSGDGWALYHAAAFDGIRNGRSAAVAFYAAVGAALLGWANIAVGLCAFSGAHADEANLRQVTDGTKTLADDGERFKWPPELTTMLQEALRTGAIPETGDDDGE